MNGNEAQIGEIILFSVILCKIYIYIYYHKNVLWCHGQVAEKRERGPKYKTKCGGKDYFSLIWCRDVNLGALLQPCERLRVSGRWHCNKGENN